MNPEILQRRYWVPNPPGPDVPYSVGFCEITTESDLTGDLTLKIFVAALDAGQMISTWLWQDWIFERCASGRLEPLPETAMIKEVFLFGRRVLLTL